MSISSVSSSFATGSSQTNSQNLFKQLQQDFKQLSESLQAGDLSGAQQAYTSISKLMQGSVIGAPTQPSGSNTVQGDFAALGQALQSGDLSTAQTAFTQLQQDLQSPASGASTTQSASTQGTHHHHHHHHGGHSTSGSADASGSSASVDGTGSTNGTISIVG